MFIENVKISRKKTYFSVKVMRIQENNAKPSLKMYNFLLTCLLKGTKMCALKLTGKTYGGVKMLNRSCFYYLVFCITKEFKRFCNK